MMITALFSSNGDRPYVESAPPLRVSDSDLTSAAGTVQEAVKPAPVTAPSPRQADEATTAPAAAVPLAEIPVAEEQDPNRGDVSVPSPRHPAPVPDLGYFIPAPKVAPTED